MDNRELDARIATKFLEWHEENGSWYKGGEWTGIKLKDFRPSISSTFCDRVIDEIERRDWNWELSYKWNSYLMVIYGWKDPSAEPGKMVKAYAKVWHDNRHRAICEAALQAAEAEGREAAA